MKIDLATIQDVPALLVLQRKAFGPLCEELDWKDAPVLTAKIAIIQYFLLLLCSDLSEYMPPWLDFGSK